MWIEEKYKRLTEPQKQLNNFVLNYKKNNEFFHPSELHSNMRAIMEKDNGNIANLLLLLENSRQKYVDKIQQHVSIVKDYDIFMLRRYLKTNYNHIIFKQCKQLIELHEAIESIDNTISSCKRLLSLVRPIQMESAEIGALNTGTVQNQSVNENFSDITGESVDSVSIGDTYKDMSGSREITRMSNYLSRPIEIGRYTIVPTNTSDREFDVWNLFTLEPSVRAKLRNFAYLKGNMKIRISVSGTPFHYGKILVSYQPYAALNESLQTLKTRVAANYFLRPLLLNYLSQSESSYIIDVKENMPLDIELPFISTKPMHRLFNESSLLIAGSFQDFVDAGDLYLYTIGTIRAATASPSPIFINIYAWMDDVELGTNTATQIAITTESMSGEMKMGPVERLSTRVYEISSGLMHIPWLSPMATATSIAAGAMKSISAIFGWSRPVLTTNVEQYRNVPLNNSALTIGNSTARRVVADPEQQLSVSSHYVADTDDSLIISSLSSRFSFLYHFDWDESDPVLTAPLYYARVHPNLNTVVTDDDLRMVQPTAMAFAVAPFSFWRGDIIFRIEIQCSAFHRGKLAIFYEPNISQFTLINGNIALNKQYMQVIDIQETQTVDFRVNWNSYRQWLLNHNYEEAVNNTTLSAPTAQGPGYCNGYIGIVPFNQLQTPDGSAARVSVYVRSDNLQVACPSSAMIYRDRSIVTESKTCLYPTEVSTLDLNKSSASTNSIVDDHFGEQVVSFRTLLKRYQTSYTLTPPSTISPGEQLFINAPIMPRIIGSYGSVVPNSLDTLSYLRYAYLGYRGSIRYLLDLNIPTDSSITSSCKVSLDGNASNNSAPNVSTLGPSNYNWNYLDGTTVDYLHTNSCIEFELPYYSNNLFSFSFNQSTDDSLSTSSMELRWFRNFSVIINGLACTSRTQRLNLSVSTGEDFNLLRFCGAPFYTFPI